MEPKMDNLIRQIQKDIETFIKSGTLGDNPPQRAVLLVNDEVHTSTESKHAEMNALSSIIKLLEANKEITMYINYSPCAVCAEIIAMILQENPEVPVMIKCAFLYRPKEAESKKGLKKLISKPNTTLETIHGDEWISVIQQILKNHGKRFWKELLNQLLEEHWASGLAKVLQEIVKCHRDVGYWKAKSFQTFINHQKHGFDTVSSEDFLDDGEKKWEEDVEKILLENGKREEGKGREQVLTEIIKHHEEDQWITVLATILKYQEKDGWRNTLTQLFQDQKEDELTTKLKVSHMVQTQELDAWGKATGILCHPENARLREMALEMTRSHRQGYVWLKVVLDALDIEVRDVWLGQRMFTDTSAASILEQIKGDSL